MPGKCWYTFFIGQATSAQWREQNFSHLWARHCKMKLKPKRSGFVTRVADNHLFHCSNLDYRLGFLGSDWQCCSCPVVKVTSHFNSSFTPTHLSGTCARCTLFLDPPASLEHINSTFVQEIYCSSASAEVVPPVMGWQCSAQCLCRCLDLVPFPSQECNSVMLYCKKQPLF